MEASHYLNDLDIVIAGLEAELKELARTMKEESKGWSIQREWRWDGRYSGVSEQLATLRALRQAWDEGKPRYEETKKLLKEDPTGRNELMATRCRLSNAKSELEDLSELLRTRGVNTDDLGYCEQCGKRTFNQEDGFCSLCGFDGVFKTDD